MTEKQLIEEILNTVDVDYTFASLKDSIKEYILTISRKDGDRRPLEQLNEEIKHYFEEANFDYTETIQPKDDLEDLMVKIKR